MQSKELKRGTLDVVYLECIVLSYIYQFLKLCIVLFLKECRSRQTEGESSQSESVCTGMILSLQERHFFLFDFVYKQLLLNQNNAILVPNKHIRGRDNGIPVLRNDTE